MFSSQVRIGSSFVGENQPAYIVAEVSANHNNDLIKAKELINYAKEIGANAVKLQSYGPDSLTLNSTKSDFLINANSPWEKHSTLYSLFSDVAMPWEWHEDLFLEARNIGIDIFSSPFCKRGVQTLINCNTDAFKIASPEIYDFSLISECMKVGKPVIISLGVADLRDVYQVINLAYENDFRDLILLKCSASYPAQKKELNLKVMQDLKEKFGCVIGFSDHTIGYESDVVAVAAGAKLIEKHICLDNDVGPDSFFSTKVSNFKLMIEKIRETEEILGAVDYEIPSSIKIDYRGRRSLYYTSNLKAGEKISLENIRAIRPAHGLHPKYLSALVGARVKSDVEMGDRVSIEGIEDISYKVVIIGLGGIGFKKNDDISEGNIETHYAYLTDNKRFEILCGIDTSKEKIKTFHKSTGCPVFDSIESAGDYIQSADLVIFSNTTQGRAESISKLSKFQGPKTYLFEKPLCGSISEASEILRICNENNINAYVNYQRRANPVFKAIKRMVSDQASLVFHCHFTGEYENIGTHFLDLFLFIVNESRFNMTQLSQGMRHYVANSHSMILNTVAGVDNYIMTISNINYEIYIDFIQGYVRIKDLKLNNIQCFELDINYYFQYVGDEILKLLDGYKCSLTPVKDAVTYLEN
jgi:pseudaminic acid synthase